MVQHEADALRLEGVRERPFDFYVAFLVFLMGTYSFIDPTYPEFLPSGMQWIVVTEDVYLVGAGLVVMAALIMKQARYNLILAVVMEMFGWLFISAAAAVIAITSPWIPPTAIPTDVVALSVVWIMLWVALATAALSRSFSIKLRIERAHR